MSTSVRVSVTVSVQGFRLTIDPSQNLMSTVLVFEIPKMRRDHALDRSLTGQVAQPIDPQRIEVEGTRMWRMRAELEQ